MNNKEFNKGLKEEIQKAVNEPSRICIETKEGKIVDSAMTGNELNLKSSILTVISMFAQGFGYSVQDVMADLSRAGKVIDETKILANSKIFSDTTNIH